nr:mediator of RNA polymerase II transcription subunit 28-like [Malus domestica]
MHKQSFFYSIILSILMTVTHSKLVNEVDVERHARDFMEAAKKLQLYFIGLQREDLPTKAEQLRKEIDAMEEELRIKTEIIKKHERLIQGWKKELKDQLDKHNTELERV